MKLLVTTLRANWWEPVPFGRWQPDQVLGEAVILLDGPAQAAEVAEWGNAIDGVLDIAREALAAEQPEIEVTEWDVRVSDGRAICEPREWERRMAW